MKSAALSRECKLCSVPQRAVRLIRLCEPPTPTYILKVITCIVFTVYSYA